MNGKDEDYIFGTILHELCHMKYDNHDANFYKLLDQLYKDLDDVEFHNKFRNSMFNCSSLKEVGEGHKLGGAMKPKESLDKNPLRNLMAKAAEKRMLY